MPQVELKQDLVGSCVVGDVITVLGMVKVLATGDAKPNGRLSETADRPGDHACCVVLLNVFADEQMVHLRRHQ